MTAQAQEEGDGGMEPTRGLAGAIRIGWMMFLGLAVLTLVEYVIAVTLDANLPIVIAIALMKACLIVYYFMHVLRVWRGREEEA